MSWLDFAPLALFAVLLGASAGSFLNVVAYRLPAGLSLVSPPSRCPRCLHRLGPTENVPVLGWLWLRGRCRHCRAPISPRYPLVEAGTALLFLAIAGRFGLSWATPGYWFFASWLVALALIDLDTMTLPDRLTRSGLALGIAVQATLGAIAGGSAGAAASLLEALLGMALGLWLFDGIALVGSVLAGRTAMGKGDAKLAAMMGAWLGAKLLLLAGFFACLLGALVGSGAILLGLRDRRAPLPFGPFLALGAAIALLAGEAIWSAYWQQWVR